MFRIVFAFLALSLFLSVPAQAGYDEGKRAYQRGDWIDAIRELRPLAEAGDDKAQLILGHMYNDGKGVSRDPVQAMSLYVQAAQKNNTHAMLAIAAMHQAGIGMEPDPATAQKWFERSALLGNQAGAFFNAIMLFKGDPSGKSALLQDMQGSYKWFLIASKMAEQPKIAASATEMARITAGRLKKTEIGTAQKEAEAFKPLAPADLPPLPGAQPSEKN